MITRSFAGLMGIARARPVRPYVMQHAPDVRSALFSLERYNGLLGVGVGPSITERGEHVVLHRAEPPRIARLQALSIAAPVGTVTLIRELTGLRQGEPLAIEAAFQHPPLPAEHLGQLEALLGCPLRFNESEMRLVLPRSIPDRAVRAPNQGLSPRARGRGNRATRSW